MTNCRLLILVQLIFLIATAWFNNVIVEALATEAIVGGSVARQGQYKYVASVQLLNKHICGGSLIGERHVLTAGHCIVGKYEEFDLRQRLTVVAGATNLREQPGERLLVLRAYVPQRFITTISNPSNQNRETGDIAVLKVNGVFDFVRNRAIAKLQLPRPARLYSSYANDEAVVAGYGCEGVRVLRHPRTNEITSEVGIRNICRLKFATAKVVPFDECIRLVNLLSPDHLCAQIKQPELDVCHGNCIGDSGNPLVLETGEVIGVVSYSPKGCDESQIPAIYTRITSFLRFINGVLNNVEMLGEIHVINLSN